MFNAGWWWWWWSLRRKRDARDASRAPKGIPSLITPFLVTLSFPSLILWTSAQLAAMSTTSEPSADLILTLVDASGVPDTRAIAPQPAAANAAAAWDEKADEEAFRERARWQLACQGVLNSLASKEMIEFESHEEFSYALTSEAHLIAREGSHEARLWEALPEKKDGAPGKSMDELKVSQSSLLRCMEQEEAAPAGGGDIHILAGRSRMQGGCRSRLVHSKRAKCFIGGPWSSPAVPLIAGGIAGYAPTSQSASGLAIRLADLSVPYTHLLQSLLFARRNCSVQKYSRSDSNAPLGISGSRSRRTGLLCGR